MIVSQSWIKALRWDYVDTELLLEPDLMHQNLQQLLFSLEFLMSPSRQKQIKKRDSFANFQFFSVLNLLSIAIQNEAN